MTEAKNTEHILSDASQQTVNPEQRWRMIAEAAYYRAEKRDFSEGDLLQDWLDAEAEIDILLQTLPGSELKKTDEAQN